MKMTQTVQPCSWALINEVEKILIIHNSPGTGQHEPSLYDSLNELMESLNELEGAIQTQVMDLNNLDCAIKNIKQILYMENEGEIE
jgi:hypothetical protein